MASDSNLQKPNIYNKFSPFDEFINEQSSMLFDEIRENLSRTIRFGELEPGFTIWSNKLEEFLTLYGFNFTKVDHLKLINFYLSILSIIDLNYRYVEICLDMLFELMRFVYSTLTQISKNRIL
jgi:proteasome activator subunit 4